VSNDSAPGFLERRREKHSQSTGPLGVVQLGIRKRFLHPTTPFLLKVKGEYERFGWRRHLLHASWSSLLRASFCVFILVSPCRKIYQQSSGSTRLAEQVRKTDKSLQDRHTEEKVVSSALVLKRRVLRWKSAEEGWREECRSVLGGAFLGAGGGGMIAPRVASITRGAF